MGLVIIWSTCSTIIFIIFFETRSIKIFNEELENITENSIVITVRFHNKSVSDKEFCEFTNNMFKYCRRDNCYTYQYAIDCRNNPPKEREILFQDGYCLSVKNTMPYILAKDGGLLEQLVEKYDATICFHCFIAPDFISAKTSLPFLFYNYDIDFLHKLNARVCIWSFP